MGNEYTLRDTLEFLHNSYGIKNLLIWLRDSPTDRILERKTFPVLVLNSGP